MWWIGLATLVIIPIAIRTYLEREFKRLAPLVLRLIADGGGESYGLDLINRSGQLSQRTVYPVLRRLEQEGFLTSYERPGEVIPERMGRPRRYYMMTPAGDAVLALRKLGSPFVDRSLILYLSLPPRVHIRVRYLMARMGARNSTEHVQRALALYDTMASLHLQGERFACRRGDEGEWHEFDLGFDNKTG
jgi:DNA-binding PadR family transcriptional regulator